MKRNRSILIRIVSDDSGATLVEYALVIGLIALFCVSAMAFLGGKISTFFTTVGNSVAGS